MLEDNKLHWTKEKPVNIGWYWFRAYPNDNPFIVCIKGFSKRGLLLTFRNKRCFLEGEWAGPIEEPKD